jgi:hypothetical protein
LRRGWGSISVVVVVVGGGGGAGGGGGGGADGAGGGSAAMWRCGDVAVAVLAVAARRFWSASPKFSLEGR